MNENNNFDDFKIDNGFEIDVPEASYDKKGKRNKKPKSDSVLKTVLWIVGIVLVAAGLAIGVIIAGFDYLGLGFGREGTRVIDVEKGSGTAVIAEKLGESGAVKLPILFRVYSKIKGYDGQYKYGVYSFDGELGYDGIADMLMNDGAKAESKKVTIIEGSNVDEIAALLDKKGVCKKADFIDAVQDGNFDYPFIDDIPVNNVHYRLEGYLYPDTYDFYVYDSKECAHLAVDKMLGNLNGKLKKAGIDTENIKVKSKSYSFHEIMTMASIVEMEASGDKTEAANVAAVFFNRLSSSDFPTLGSSPTRKYPYGNGSYNTYECKGIPVGPLCSPGIDTIKSTCSPTKNFDYYYFVTDKSMKFYYRNTLAEHNSIIAKLKAENNWIYED